MKLKKIAMLVSGLIMLSAFTACNGGNETEEKNNSGQIETDDDKVQEKEESESVQGSAVESQEEIPANQNLLTGVWQILTDAAIGKRPGSGYGQQCLLCNAPVWRGDRRILSLRSRWRGDRYPVLWPYMGIIPRSPRFARSAAARYYFPALSQGFDAFYVNWGN